MKNSPAHAGYTAEFFVLRTPLLPIEEFLGLSLAATEPRPDGSGGDRAFARAHLRRWVERPEVREALWIASPEFLQSLTMWWDNPESAKGRKLEQTLYRYLSRMTARSTPFGAFAGCSTGDIADVTLLELGPRGRYRRHTRLDMEYLCNLAERLTAYPAVRSNFRFRCNTTLHLAAGKYHHVRGAWHDGDLVFELVATDPTPALDATLTRAASGATAGELGSSLVAADPEIAPEEADTFVGRLIESQLLISELVPPITGTEPIQYMIEQLEQAKASAVADDLRMVAGELRAIDRGGLGASPRAYDGIVSAVARLGGAFRPGRLVQVDVIKPPAAASLDRQIVDDVLVAVQTLHSIRDNSGQSAFQQFIEEFRERYQDKEVPLLEALDDEAGIGFENEDNPTAEPLIAGIDFRLVEQASQEEDQSRQLVLERRLERLRERKETVLALDLALIDELRVTDPLPLPDAFTVMGASFRGTGGQPGFYAHTIFGPSGANLLARFRTDERLVEHIQTHVRTEETLQARKAIFAEIVHLPEGRVGNVICRPVLRKYEIPLLATPGVPADRQIALSDLTVALRDGRIVLRSRRLRAEVLPRLTSAHNFTNSRSLKLYKFLCLLQHQGTCSDFGWDWGAAGKAPFLPRVALRNIVVSRASWRINKETSLELAQGQISVDQWRLTNQVPRFAFIAELDNQLLIDFENPLAVETFLEHIRKEPEAVLMEMLPDPGALAVHGPEGSFVHEIILPFVRKRPAVTARVAALPAARTAPLTSNASPSLKLEPGSEWLFAKIYCSPSHLDRLLLELVQPLVAQIMPAGAARSWFFLRYGDPRWHLRLRFHGDPAALRDYVLPALNQAVESFCRQGTLWRLEFDRYEPELDRYGGPLGIRIAEQLFQFDSELCLELLSLVQSPLLSGDDGARLRWQLALCGADRILEGLGFSPKGKKTLAEHMRASREQAWVVDETYRRQLGHKFRSGEMRQTLTTLLNVFDDDAGNQANTILPQEAVSAFRPFSDHLRIIRKQWKNLQQTGQLTATLPELTESIVHMHLNRMLRSCHHEQEAVLYDFLVRTYSTRLARQDPTSLAPDAIAP